MNKDLDWIEIPVQYAETLKDRVDPVYLLEKRLERIESLLLEMRMYLERNF